MTAEELRFVLAHERYVRASEARTEADKIYLKTEEEFRDAWEALTEQQQNTLNDTFADLSDEV